MISTIDIKAFILNAIKYNIPSVTFANEYNEQDIYNIQQQPLICIYLKKLTTKSNALNDLLHYEELPSEVNLTYGKQANVVIGISIFSKNLHSNTSCEAIFDQISNILLFDKTLNVEEIAREDISFQQNYNVYQLNAQISLQAMLIKQEQEETIRDFTLHLDAKPPKGGIL